MPAILASTMLGTAIAGGAAAGATVYGSKKASQANQAAAKATADAAAKADAFQRQQDAENRAEEARQAAEDKRRYDIDQENQRRTQAQNDFLLRQQIEEKNQKALQRYTALKNLAGLAGVAPPPDYKPQELPPSFALPTTAPTQAPTSDVPRTITPPTIGSMNQPQPTMTPYRPSASMVPPPATAEAWSPFAMPQQIPMRRLYSAGRA